MSSASGMPRLSSTGRTARVQTPCLPMKTTWRLRLKGGTGDERQGPEITQQGRPRGGLVGLA
jgi:hypothetical protein